jgi:predicted neuraminidase
LITRAEKEMIFDEAMPTPACHASTVLPLPNGEVLAAWFGGEHEKAKDVDIWVSCRSNGKWGKAVQVSAAADIAHWNPVLFLHFDGTACLYFKIGDRVKNWQTWFSTSKDNGKTWSTPQELVPGDKGNGRGPVKNKNLRLSDGRILAPASSETDGRWLSFIDMSFDDGLTWEQQQNVPSRKPHRKYIPMIQPSLWESAPGIVHMLTRTGVGRIYRSDSEDYGSTWCMAYKTPLLNNNSGLDVAKVDDGTLYLVSNPVAENWGVRTPLTLMMSKDNGTTWEEAFVLEKEEGEYSYPAIVAEGNKLYITYTWKREKVAFWLMDIE